MGVECLCVCSPSPELSLNDSNPKSVSNELNFEIAPAEQAATQHLALAAQLICDALCPRPRQN